MVSFGKIISPSRQALRIVCQSSTNSVASLTSASLFGSGTKMVKKITSVEEFDKELAAAGTKAVCVSFPYDAFH